MHETIAAKQEEGRLLPRLSRSALLITLAGWTAGCASQPFPVPTELQTAAETYEVPLANEGTSEFGPYKLKYQQMKGELFVDEHGRSQFVGDTHVNVQREGDTPSALECNFEEFHVSCAEPGTPWTLTFRSHQLTKPRTGGELSDGNTKLTLAPLYRDHGVHEEWVGYTISMDGTAKLAISRSKFGSPPQIWIAADAPNKPHLVAAAISLLPFDPTIAPGG